MSDDMARLRDEVAGVLAEHRAGGYFAAPDGHRECYCGHVMAADESYEAHVSEVALMPLLARVRDEARGEALRLPRAIEAEMSDRAAQAWRSADARRGLSDHEALLVHADALTRWSERFRIAFDGDDYRDGVAP